MTRFILLSAALLAVLIFAACATDTMITVIVTPTPGQDPTPVIQSFRGQELKEYRTMVQAVFQDPWSSLSPRMRVRDIVSEALVVNRNVTRQERDDRVEEVLNQVGLQKSQADLYPHEFSGGSRRIVRKLPQRRFETLLVQVAGHHVVVAHVLLNRYLHRALVHGEGTPGVEAAARRGVDGGGHFSQQHDLLPFHIGVGGQRC